MLARHRARQVVNTINLSTPAGLLLAAMGQATTRRWRKGLLTAHGYRLPFPAAPAFVLGNVVLIRSEYGHHLPEGLLAHEERHTTQYAYSGGILMPALYLGACGWSWLRTGDFFSRNVFEVRAGLAEGGYTEHPLRRRQPQHHGPSTTA